MRVAGRSEAPYGAFSWLPICCRTGDLSPSVTVKSPSVAGRVLMLIPPPGRRPVMGAPYLMYRCAAVPCFALLWRGLAC